MNKNNTGFHERHADRYQKKQLGKRYWIRVIFLLVLIVFITWYAKEGYNNPFEYHPHINLVGTDYHTYIRCYKKLKSKEKGSFLILLSQLSTDKQTISTDTFPETETFITTTTRDDMYNGFNKPPLNFIVLDTVLVKDSFPNLPAQWPKPSFTNDMAGLKDITVHYLYPFDDSTTALFVEYNNISILIFNAVQIAADTLTRSFLKEKIDIVLLNTTSTVPISVVRNIFRPRYIIILPAAKTPAHIQSIPNIIRPKKSHFSYEFVKDSKERLCINQ